jgi:zinc protease
MRIRSIATLTVAGALCASLAAALAAAQPEPRSPSGRAVARGSRTAPAAQPAGPRPSDALFAERPEVERLPNGLTVVTARWPSPGIVAYYTMVRVGSRDEVEEGHSGFAHFFEHMMFRGTERTPQAVYDRTLQGFGADNNAFTTSDYTCYTITAPSAALPTLVELEADRFQNLSYSEDVFRTEAGAVRGEYQVWSSNPFQPMYEALSEMAFTRHTYGHTTIGYLRDIEAMPTRFEYARRFFRRYYTPDNTFLIVVGDFDRDALLAKVRQEYGGWRGRRDQPRIPVEPEPTQGARRDLPWRGATPPRLFAGWRIPAFEPADPRRRAEGLRETAALQIVHDLAFDESAPLYQRLVVQERRLLELGSSGGDHSRDPGLFMASATLAPGQDFDVIIDAIQAELARIAAGEMPAERVRAVQQHLRYAQAMALETPSSAAGFLAEMLAVSGRIEAIDDYLQALADLSPEDVARVAGRYLVPTRRFVVTLDASRAAAPEAGATPAPATEAPATEAAAAEGGAS